MAEKYRSTVLDFFKAWEPGIAAMAQAYRHYLAEDVAYENAGLPPCHGIDEAVTFMEASCQIPGVNFETVWVEVRHIASVRNVVLTERIDWHYDANGNVALMPHICGIMEFNDADKIQRWADYFDPSSWPSQT